MTREQFVAAAVALHGGKPFGAQRALAERLGVSYGMVRQVACGNRIPPEDLARRIREALGERPVTVALAAPPDGAGERREACAATVEGALAQLLEAAERLGWRRDEVRRAAAAWAARSGHD